MKKNTMVILAILLIITGLVFVFIIDDKVENDSIQNNTSGDQTNGDNLEDKMSNETDANESKIIKIGVMDYSPYQYMEDDVAKGISIDILTKALDELGYNYEFVGRPWSRILEEAQSNKIDILMDSYDVLSRRKFISYSSYPLSAYTISIYKNKSTDLVYDGTFESIKNYALGSIRDYNYSTEITSAIEDGTIKFKNTDTPEDNFLNLEKGLVDYIIEEKVVGDNFLKNNSYENIVEDSLPYDNRYTYFGFINTPEMSKIRIQVDELMKKYYQDGTIEKIYSNYGLEEGFRALKVSMSVSPPIKRIDYAQQIEPVKIGVLNYTPPFSYKDGDQLKGIYIDLLTEALERSNIRYEFMELPFSRILEMTKTGKINIGVDVFINDERKANGIFLEKYPIAEYAYALCSRVESNFEFDGNIESLKGKNIGIVRGYTLGAYDYLYSDEAYNFDYTDDTTKLLNNLINSRIDLAIEVKSTAKLSLRDLGYDKDVIIDENFYISNLSYLYLTDNEFSRALIDELSYSFSDMRKDGTIEKIFKKYDMLDSMPRIYKWGSCII